MKIFSCYYGSCIKLDWKNYKCHCNEGYAGRHCEFRDPCFKENPYDGLKFKPACESGFCVPLPDERVPGLLDYECICPPPNEVEEFNRKQS